MGYMHIDNLYKYPDIFLFKRCYCLEKIHGTSAHITWKDGQLNFFSGGGPHDKFVAIFPQELVDRFATLHSSNVTVYGEAYGGKCQGMSGTYGKALKFVAFDVLVGKVWLSVPDAAGLTASIGLEFVDYAEGPCELDFLNVQRDADSVQAVRNGCGPGKMREGVVVRPLMELTKNNGDRIICKHKRDEFKETKTPRDVDQEQLKVLAAANAIASEWVTPMRLVHVLDKFDANVGMERTKDIIAAMCEDVRREAGAEIVWGKDAARAIGHATVALFKKHLLEKEVT